MKPILTILKNEQEDSLNHYSPIDDLTFIDRINSYALIQTDLVLTAGTKYTAISRETTDDQ